MFKRYPKTKLILMFLVPLAILTWIVQVPGPWSKSLDEWLVERLAVPGAELPRRANGQINFRSLLEDLTEVGVKPEGNWSVLLFQVYPEDHLGEPTWGDEELAALGRKLGVSEAGDSPGPLLMFEPVISEYLDNHPGQSEDDLWIAMDQPWQSASYPEVQAWLDANEGALDFFASGSDRPRFSLPGIVQSEDSLLGSDALPMFKAARDVARMFRIRALQHLGEGRLSDCLADAAVVRKMGARVREANSLLGKLLGLAISGIAADIEAQALAHGDWSVAESQRYREFLESSQTDVDWSTAYLTERYTMFDLLQGFVSGELNSDQMMAMQGGGNIPFGMFGMQGMVDWVAVAEVVDEQYGTLIEISAVEDTVLEQKLLDEFEALHAEKAARMGEPLPMIGRFVGGARSRGRLVGDVLVSQMLPAHQQIRTADLREQMNQSMRIIGLSLELARQEQGGYPADLSGLEPELVNRHAQDLFTGRPLIYRPLPNGYVLYSVGPNQLDELIRSDGTEKSPQELEGSFIDDLRYRLRVVRDSAGPANNDE